MAKKIFLNGDRTTPIVHAPSVIRKKPHLEVAFLRGNILEMKLEEQLHFMIFDEI